MPTTPNGTAYTVYTATLPVHGLARWAVADSHAGDADIPAVLYAHGSGGSSDQFETLPAWAGLRNWLIDNGWAWVEGQGGTVNGAQNWGNAAARAAYPAYLAHVETVLDLGTVVLLGRSMGGLVTAWLAAMYPGRDRFAGWICNSGVATMLVGSGTLASPSIERTTGLYFGATCWAAFGATTYEEFVDVVGDAAPESWAPSVWDGRNVLMCYGTADTTVPWSPRGGGPLRDLWAGRPATDDVSPREGGDHSQGNGSYGDVAAMVPFLLTMNGDPIPEPPRFVYRRQAAYLVAGGRRYPIAMHV